MTHYHLRLQLFGHFNRNAYDDQKTCGAERKGKI